MAPQQKVEAGLTPRRKHPETRSPVIRHVPKALSRPPALRSFSKGDICRLFHGEVSEASEKRTVRSIVLVINKRLIDVVWVPS